jgi:hypothetical protein
LSFVSRSDNQENRISYNEIEGIYDNEISVDAIVVNEYNGHHFEDLYFHDNIFYFFTGIQYRRLYINETRGRLLYVNVRNIHHQRVKIFYSKFQRERDLI